MYKLNFKFKVSVFRNFNFVTDMLTKEPFRCFKITNREISCFFRTYGLKISYVEP